MTHPPTSAPRDPGLRASDADRERTAAALRRHHLDGRLETDELQERVGRCYAARTEGELAALTADLPADQPPGRDRAMRAGARLHVPLVAVLLVALALAGTLAAAAHGHAGPFPFLVLFLVLRLGRGRRRRWSAGGTRV
jgi:hypothetical protein